MRRYRNSVNAGEVVAVAGILFILAVLAVTAYGFFFVTEPLDGTLSSKWVETSVSCDSEGKNCMASNSYYFQTREGEIFSATLGPFSGWNQLQPGDCLSFTARGWRVELWGARVLTREATAIRRC